LSILKQDRSKVAVCGNPPGRKLASVSRLLAQGLRRLLGPLADRWLRKGTHMRVFVGLTRTCDDLWLMPLRALRLRSNPWCFQSVSGSVSERPPNRPAARQPRRVTALTLLACPVPAEISRLPLYPACLMVSPGFEPEQLLASGASRPRSCGPII
jgi:hypothetical protein